MATCSRWWVYLSPRVGEYDLEPYRATMGLRCTRHAKTRDQERSVAPNLVSHPTQILIQINCQHEVCLIIPPFRIHLVSIQSTCLPKPTCHGNVRVNSSPLTTTLCLTGSSAQLDMLFKTKSMPTFDGTCKLNKSASSAHCRILDLDRPVVSRKTSEIAYVVLQFLWWPSLTIVIPLLSSHPFSWNIQ